MVKKKKAGVLTNIVSDVQPSQIIKPYSQLCYKSDYRADGELTMEEFKNRIEKVKELQRKNEEELRRKNAKKRKEIEAELEL